jgi:hypothetical protein
VTHSAALVHEIAIQLATWRGVSIDRRSENIATVRYERMQLGVLDRDSGVVELHLSLACWAGAPPPTDRDGSDGAGTAPLPSMLP